MNTDFVIENHGSIVFVRPLTPGAVEWLKDHTPQSDDHQYFGNALVVEPRYLANLVEGIQNDGLTIL